MVRVPSAKLCAFDSTQRVRLPSVEHLPKSWNKGRHEGSRHFYGQELGRKLGPRPPLSLIHTLDFALALETWTPVLEALDRAPETATCGPFRLGSSAPVLCVLWGGEGGNSMGSSSSRVQRRERATHARNSAQFAAGWRARGE